MVKLPPPANNALALRSRRAGQPSEFALDYFS
jgi:hypothetical protein